MQKNALIIVEGKSDIQKLKSIYPSINTFATSGNHISKEKITTIQRLAETNTIYIFTDPDYAGRKIRNKIAKALNDNCFHIYLINSQIKKKKNGLAEASIEDIKESFKNYFQKNKSDISKISYAEYLNLELNTKKIRKFVCNELKIEYYNHKQLYKMLVNLNIDAEKIRKILIKYEEN